MVLLDRWRWKKCIEKQGDCVEKWCYYKFFVFIEIKFISVLRIIIDSPTYMVYKGLGNVKWVLPSSLFFRYFPTPFDELWVWLTD
jgi:hypothetical protein